jgi:hypothetical protein
MSNARVRGAPEHLTTHFNMKSVNKSMVICRFLFILCFNVIKDKFGFTLLLKFACMIVKGIRIIKGNYSALLYTIVHRQSTVNRIVTGVVT